MEQEFELIAKTFMGLEPVLAQELTSWVLTKYISDEEWFRSQATKKWFIVQTFNCTLPSEYLNR